MAGSRKFDRQVVEATNIANSSFGDVAVVQTTPFIVGQGVYNFIPSNFRQFTATSGSAADLTAALT